MTEADIRGCFAALRESPGVPDEVGVILPVAEQFFVDLHRIADAAERLMRLAEDDAAT